jgi:hypothetical protein
MQPARITELPSDSNEIKAGVRSFEGLGESISEVSNKSRSEMRQWRDIEDDNRVALARAVQRQLENELEFIKLTATEENAKNTVDAVNTLINTKDDRSRIIIRELTAQIRKEQKVSRTASRNRISVRTASRTNPARGVEDGSVKEQPVRTMPIQEQKTDKYNPETKDELDLWLDANVTEFYSIISFAKAIDEKIHEEYRPVRQVAVEENASKTVAAIDGILLVRQERIAELGEQLEAAKARAENAEETRTTRGRSRTDRGAMAQESGSRRRR